jgi:hypothetical protein
MLTLKQKLCSAAIRYDQKQSKKASYNRYALPQYLSRISEICATLPENATDADIRKALMQGFCGRLADQMLAAAGQPKATNEEARACRW